MRILLDTNAYSDWRRSGRWNGVISTADKVLVPAIVLGELRYGFLRSSRGEENERKLLQFLDFPAVGILAVGEATSRIYANLKDFLRNAGTPIPENDVWIAALAAESMSALVSADTHFDNLPQIARVVE